MLICALGERRCGTQSSVVSPRVCLRGSSVENQNDVLRLAPQSLLWTPLESRKGGVFFSSYLVGHKVSAVPPAIKCGNQEQLQVAAVSFLYCSFVFI